MARKFKSVDVASHEEAWKKLHAIADEASPDLVKAFLRSVMTVRNGMSLPRLEKALRNHDYETVLRETNWQQIIDTELRPEIARTLRDVLEASGEAARLPVNAEISFNIVNPRVFEWIATRTGELITVINTQTLDAVRDIIRQSFVDGEGPLVAAGKIRDFIGLNQRQAGALDKYAKTLAEKGLKESRQRTLIEAYERKLLKERATTIARTETMAASSRGWDLQIEAAKDEGLLDPAKWEVAWLITPDDALCPKCLTMKGARKPIGGLYDKGEYKGTVGPPQHPNCRCSQLVKRKVAEIQKAA